MNNKSFTLKFTGNATNKGSMRNDIEVSFESMNETFKLATDEGAFHGGKGTAPPPLALFTASLCGCIMTQIKAFGKKLKIEVNEIEIDASMEWQGEVLEEGPYKASCDEYNLDIDNLDETDLNLIKGLIKFEYLFRLALINSEPHHLADYLYQLSNLFNSMYQGENIVENKNEVVKYNKLKISQHFIDYSKLLMELLGLSPVNRM